MRPLVMLLGPGQGGDAPMFEHVLAALKVPRAGRGRPRTTPVRALADKAYSKAIRAMLRRRGVQAVIPERSDQIANRARRGSRGGRPVGYDAEACKRHDLVGRSFNVFKQWRGVAHRVRRARPDLPRRCGPARHHHLAQGIRRHALGLPVPA